MTGAVPDRAAVRVLELVELLLATDDRRPEAALVPGRGAIDRDEPIRRNRLLPTLDDKRRQRLDGDRVPDAAQGLLAEQDRPRRRRLLEPCDHVQRVPCRQPLRRPRHHLAGVERRPQLEPDPVVGLQSFVQRHERLAHVPGRADGPQGVVLVQHRDPEHAHHRVADELLDGPAVTLDDGFRRREVPRHRAAQAFRIELVAERRRPRHVGAENSDRLPRLPHRSVRRERLCARVAEARALRVFVPATCANRHKIQCTAATAEWKDEASTTARSRGGYPWPPHGAVVGRASRGRRGAAGGRGGAARVLRPAARVALEVAPRAHGADRRRRVRPGRRRVVGAARGGADPGRRRRARDGRARAAAGGAAGPDRARRGARGGDRGAARGAAGARRRPASRR